MGVRRDELMQIFTESAAGVTNAEIRAHLAWENTGIPRRLWGYTLREHTDSYPEAAPLSQWVTEYRERHQLDDNGYPRDRAGFGTGVFLYGPPGRGKTTSACATLTSFAKLYDQSVYFVRWDNFLRMKQATIAENVATYSQIIAAVENSTLVVLDDVGQEYSASAYGPAQFVQLIRHRFDRGLPTFVTTNLSEAEWTRRYDGTVTSFVKRACKPMSFSPPASADAG